MENNGVLNQPVEGTPLVRKTTTNDVSGKRLTELLKEGCHLFET